MSDEIEQAKQALDPMERIARLEKTVVALVAMLTDPPLPVLSPEHGTKLGKILIGDEE